MANFLLSQTGEEVQQILNEAPETKQDLASEVTNREEAVSEEAGAREQGDQTLHEADLALAQAIENEAEARRSTRQPRVISIPPSHPSGQWPSAVWK